MRVDFNVATVLDAGIPIDLNDRRFLHTALADPAGVPRCGRAAEYAFLRQAGYRDLALGRLYEGHVNALQLIAHHGTAAQRAQTERDIEAGRLFGVWNTQASDGVRMTAHDDASVLLSGRKTFCSGAGTVLRALITAADAAGAPQLILVPMDETAAAIDPSFWQPMGMQSSDSFAVDFSGVRVAATALIGAPGAYQAAPWFTGGASRFVAVQTGGIERLCDEFAAFLRRRGMSGDTLQLARLGDVAVAAASAGLWSTACVNAWEAFDRDGSAQTQAALLATVDAARAAVEAAALAVCERIERGAGARGLLEPEPFGALICDLRMYLRQPAPDAALLRVAQAALERTRAI
jgi:alkylation response protein AidB-like acyl-CoA dehydrogenase